MSKMENKLGQEPIFPVNDDNYGNVGMHSIGISKRFYAACCAMQGILANPHFRETAGNNPIVISELSFEMADEILKQENL